MKRLLVLSTLAAIMVPVVPAAAAPQACGPSAAMKRQNAALRRQVTKLTGRVDKLSADLALTNERLRIAQTGVTGTILTMNPLDVFNQIFPSLRALFNRNEPRFEASVYTSGSDYASYTFTFCGFC